MATATPSMSTSPAQRPRPQRGAGNARVQQGVRRADATSAPVSDRRPVRQAGGCGGNGEDHTEADEPLGGRTRRPGGEHVQQAGPDPTAEREVGEQRVQRMSRAIGHPAALSPARCSTGPPAATTPSPRRRAVRWSRVAARQPGTATSPADPRRRVARRVSGAVAPLSRRPEGSVFTGTSIEPADLWRREPRNCRSRLRRCLTTVGQPRRAVTPGEAWTTGSPAGLGHPSEVNKVSSWSTSVASRSATARARPAPPAGARRPCSTPAIARSTIRPAARRRPRRVVRGHRGAMVRRWIGETASTAIGHPVPGPLAVHRRPPVRNPDRRAGRHRRRQTVRLQRQEPQPVASVGAHDVRPHVALEEVGQSGTGGTSGGRAAVTTNGVNVTHAAPS